MHDIRSCISRLVGCLRLHITINLTTHQCAQVATNKVYKYMYCSYTQWSIVCCQPPWKQVNYNSCGCLSEDQDFLNQEHGKALKSEGTTEAYRVDLYGKNLIHMEKLFNLGAWSPGSPVPTPMFWMIFRDRIMPWIS